MYKTQNPTDKYYQMSEDSQVGLYRSVTSNLAVAGEGYDQLAVLSSDVSHAIIRSSMPIADSRPCVLQLGHPTNLFQPFETQPSFIIKQKDREIAYLKETVNEMKRRLSQLERDRSTAPIYVRAITIQEKPINEIYNLVLDYYNSHPSAYPDEVADVLGLDLRKVIEVVDKLITEDKIEVAT